MSVTNEGIQEILDAFPDGIPPPPPIDYNLADAPTASTFFSEFRYAESPRPPSGFRRLLDELYPDNESCLSDDEWLNPHTWVADGLETDGWSDVEFDDFIAVQALFEQSMENTLNPSNPGAPVHQAPLPPNQNAMIQTPWSSSSSSVPPMPPLPTQPSSSGGPLLRAAFSPDMPEGEFDFGPMLDFSQLTDEFFPESVNWVPGMASLNEWPDDGGSLLTGQGAVIQTGTVTETPIERVERAMGGLHLNDRQDEPSVSGGQT
ncbi:hypothetical protein BDV93DRAFT_525407 [Ceratobasidium sp. AG-I]|nr:hypothetical protein BDV93DRAFT_525407 [Ceratobasidium sp. AG-I]